MVLAFDAHRCFLWRMGLAMGHPTVRQFRHFGKNVYFLFPSFAIAESPI
jgi:hypothetical protein